MSRPLLLDLFCGAGGAAVGYHRAGFDVVGVDIVPQPNYPFEFIRADALNPNAYFSASRSKRLVAIHASPPCQAHSQQTQDRTKHTNLIPETRDLLERFELPYVIENVVGAGKHLIDPVRLCGSSFGMDVQRHRLFETNWLFLGQPCDHSWWTPRFRSLRIDYHRAGKLAKVVGVHGHLNYPGEFPIRCKAMEIDWMTNAELVQSIPPKYTEYIGEQLLKEASDGEAS